MGTDWMALQAKTWGSQATQMLTHPSQPRSCSATEQCATCAPLHNPTLGLPRAVPPPPPPSGEKGCSAEASERPLIESPSPAAPAQRAETDARAIYEEARGSRAGRASIIARCIARCFCCGAGRGAIDPVRLNGKPKRLLTACWAGEWPSRRLRRPGPVADAGVGAGARDDDAN